MAIAKARRLGMIGGLRLAVDMLAMRQDITPPLNPAFARTIRPIGLVLANRSDAKFYHTVNRINANYHIVTVTDFAAWGGSGIFTWVGQPRDVRTLSSPAKTATEWGCVPGKYIAKVTCSIGFRRSGDGGNAPAWRSAGTDNFTMTVTISSAPPETQNLPLTGQAPWINWNQIPIVDPASPHEVTSYEDTTSHGFGPSGSGITYQFGVAFEPSAAADNGLLDCKFQLYYMEIRFDYKPI